MALFCRAANNVLITSVGLLKNDRFAKFNSKPSVKQEQNISDEKKPVINGAALSKLGSFDDPFNRNLLAPDE